MTPSPENGFEGISIPNYTLFHIPDYYSTNTYSVITPERCPKDEINSFNDTVSSIIDKNENNDYLEQLKIVLESNLNRLNVIVEGKRIIRT